MHDIEKFRPDIALAIERAMQAGKTTELNHLIDRAITILTIQLYEPPFARKLGYVDAAVRAKESVAAFLAGINKPTPTGQDTRSIDEFIRRTGAQITHQDLSGADGCYYHEHDYIAVKPRETWPAHYYYYSVVFHELVHWTLPRLKREDPSKEEEEIVAETGSYLLCRHFGLQNTHVSYINHYLNRLPSDRGESWMRAAKRAQEAVDYLLSL